MYMHFALVVRRTINRALRLLELSPVGAETFQCFSFVRVPLSHLALKRP